MNLTFEKDFPEQVTRPFDPVERVQIKNLRYLSTVGVAFTFLLAHAFSHQLQVGRRG